MDIKKYFIFIFLASAFLFSTCKKDDLESQNGTPVFYAKGSLSGNLFSISAGVSNYYMYSSYSSDPLSIYQFNGELKEKDCTSSCPQSLSVHIRDYHAHNLQPTSIDSALGNGSYNFVLPVSGSYTVAFTSQIYADSVTAYYWNFGDNGTSSLANPVHTYTTAGIEQVRLTVFTMHNNTSCSSSIIDSVDVGTTPVIIPSFTMSPSGVDTVIFTGSATGGTSPYTYHWVFGNNTFADGSPVFHYYPTPGIDSMRLYVTDANNITERIKKNILTPNADQCYANFTWQNLGSLAPDLSKVIVEWTDAAGNVYTSANAQQPASSSFQIISVENYDANENQQSTKKIHLLVNCTLYHGSNTLLLQNADIVFAIAYP